MINGCASVENGTQHLIRLSVLHGEGSHARPEAGVPQTPTKHRVQAPEI